MLGVLGSKESHLGVIMFPEVENGLSRGTLVASIQRNCLAIFTSTYIRKTKLAVLPPFS